MTLWTLEPSSKQIEWRKNKLANYYVAIITALLIIMMFNRKCY